MSRSHLVDPRQTVISYADQERGIPVYCRILGVDNPVPPTELTIVSPADRDDSDPIAPQP